MDIQHVMSFKFKTPGENDLEETKSLEMENVILNSIGVDWQQYNYLNDKYMIKEVAILSTALLLLDVVYLNLVGKFYGKMIRSIQGSEMG